MAAGACQCAPLLAADPQEAAALRWASTVAYLVSGREGRLCNHLFRLSFQWPRVALAAAAVAWARRAAARLQARPFRRHTPRATRSRHSLPSLAIRRKAHYSAVCADTWASEVGILSRSPPRLITNWRRAPPGTNGAVSPLGCACSAAAGLFMGISFWALGAALGDVALVPARGVASSSAAAGDSGGGKGAALAAGACWAAAGLAAGVAGSLVDSLLGATVQFSGVDPKSGKVVGRPGPGVRRVSGRPWLSNDEVNAAAAAITSLGAAALAWRMVR